MRPAVPGRPRLPTIAALLACLAANASAEPGRPIDPLPASPAADEVVLGCFVPPGATSKMACDQQAIAEFAYEVRRRTSVRLALAPTSVACDPRALYRTPLLLWQGSGPQPMLPLDAARQLGRWLDAGGMMLVDPSDAEGTQARAAFVASVEAALAAALPGATIGPLPPEHVLGRAFYLLDGRAQPRLSVRALALFGRAAVVFADAPWLCRPAEAQGAMGGEQRLRRALNWLMYGLCLDYKDDQVHLPFLLERRGAVPVAP